MTKIWSSFAFGSGLDVLKCFDLFCLARVVDIEVLISYVKFGSFETFVWRT